MAKNEPSRSATGSADGAQADTSRKNHVIRFSDSEWGLIDNEARKREVSASEFVRIAALEAATGKAHGPPGAISPKLASYIENIDRGVYLLATLKRNEMIREGRRKELDEMVREAKRIQDNSA